MTNTLDKKHWYDGSFYAKLIDPWTGELRDVISSFIENDASVVDVACGTGALAIALSQKCKRVVGVELSSKMFMYANQRKADGSHPNVEFVHSDAQRLVDAFDTRFDYATISFALHEMSAEDRIIVVNQMRLLAPKIIIADFLAPLPQNLKGMITALMEFMAGMDHFNGFRSFVYSGGIDNILHQCGLKIEDEVIDKTNSYKVTKASSSNSSA
ncbi:MAG: class I SAM-dependent methyltransferase [Nitrospirae bacterium]|nr:class I SAM-dependent methyltransferase [Nitrospirota bacterium]